MNKEHHQGGHQQGGAATKDKTREDEMNMQDEREEPGNNQ